MIVVIIMRINGTDISVDDAIKIANLDSCFLKKRKNGMMLSDYAIEVLKRNGIDYQKYNNMSSLLFEIEDILNEEENDELDEISRQIAEFHYYNETNK